MRLQIACVSATLALCAGAASAADVTGVWLATARSAHVRVYRCGSAVCGRMVSATTPKSNPKLLDVHNKDPLLRGRRLVGAVLLQGFKGGPQKWTGGRLYNPGDGNSYKGALTLIDRDHLRLEGCALAILCKSQTWTRLK